MKLEPTGETLTVTATDAQGQTIDQAFDVL